MDEESRFKFRDVFEVFRDQKLLILLIKCEIYGCRVESVFEKKKKNVLKSFERLRIAEKNLENDTWS